MGGRSKNKGARSATTARLVVVLGLMAATIAISMPPSAGAFTGRKPVSTPSVIAATRPVAPAETSPQGHQWFDSVIQYHQYYRGCFPEGWIYAFVQTYVGYEYEPDGSFPKVGDTYYAHIVSAVAPLSSCAGGADLYTQVILPDNTDFAVDATHPVKCWYTFENGPRHDVTNESDAGCPTNPSKFNVGQYGPKMGIRIVPNGSFFEIEFPLRSTQPLHGMGQNGSQLVAPTIVTLAENDITDPREWVTVTGSAPSNNPFITYPQPSATNITKHDAKTTADVYTEGKTGHVYFQMGKRSGSYGLYQKNVPDLLNSGGGYEVWANQWNKGHGGLAAGTTYHWRMCFNPSTGSNVCGIDQKFKTLPGEKVRPKVTPPQHALATGIQLGDDTQNKYVPVGFRWDGSDNGTPDKKLKVHLLYRIEWRVFQGGQWKAWKLIPGLGFERANTATLGIFPGFKYQFRVQAKDNAGNVSGWAVGKALTPKLVQAESTKVTTTGTWFGASNPEQSGGTSLTTTTVGNKATLVFKGRSFAPVMVRDSTKGTASVCVDHSPCKNVNLHKGVASQRMLVFSVDGLSLTTKHKIVVKDAGGEIWLDAFAILT